ncbi:FadR/GntR family transcriptional regulator [Salinibacterium sp. GXW1014]|uniref:FadR/GntR family transcriptional regulator n=1 Tax=Salinibacterium sp. GXW1014 TaxID=3377838 RepID=UPI00383BA579
MSDSLTTLTRRVLFAPLTEPGRTETVVSRIRSAITLGIYANGEQLPNEVDLAAQLSISPVTLRDALKVVREEGLVHTTRGRSGGTFVIAPDESNMGYFERSLAALSVIEVRDLLDWQVAILSQAAVLAAERASAQDTQSLSMTLESFGEASNAMAARRAHSRFLIELAASSRSARLSRAAIASQVEYAPHAMLVFRSGEHRSAVAERSLALLEAVSARDAEGTHALIEALLGHVGDRILELHHEVSRRASA